MLYEFFVLSIITLLIGIIFIIKQRNSDQKIISSYQWLMIFVFVAAMWFFVPYYFSFFQADHLSEKIFNTFFLSAYRAICLFVAGADYNELYHYAITKGNIGVVYSLYGSVLYLISPIMTFGFVLSLFESITVRVQIFFNGKKNVYIFSELNELSLFLADDICKKHPKSLVIFSHLDIQIKENVTLLEKKVKSIGAVYLKKDIISILDLFPRKNKIFNCIIMGENEEINVEQTILLLQMEHTYKLNVYVCSKKENHFFEDLRVKERTALFCNNPARITVLQALEKNGVRFFENAVEAECGDRTIGTIVLGMGIYGTEMVKALSWYTQAVGYNTKIYCFDKDPYAEERFVHFCPGYFEYDDNRAHCDIKIYSGIACGTRSFDKIVTNLKDISYVFVALGNDDLNINTAYELCTEFARVDNYPVIQTLVQNDNKRRLMEGKKNYRNEEYNIEYVGSLQDVYTFEAFFSDNLKSQVLEWYTTNKTLKEGEAYFEELFLSDRYQQYESTVVHQNLIEKLQMTPIQMFESLHRCMLNTMFGEGYLYTSNDDKNIKLIAKLNPCLYDFNKIDDLSQK